LPEKYLRHLQSGTALEFTKGDTLNSANGVHSGKDYSSTFFVFATHKSIHCLRQGRARTFPRLSEPPLGGY